MRLERATFTASEAATVSGVGVDKQREFRRKGHKGRPDIDKGAGKRDWSRYDLRAVAELAIIGVLAELGLKPSASARAIEENARKQSAGAIIFGLASNDPRAIRDPKGLCTEPPVRMAPGGWPRFLVASGSNPYFAKSLDEALGKGPASVVVDLHAIADRIVTRCSVLGKHLVEIVEDLK